MGIRYAVSIEVCHIMCRNDADSIAEQIRDRLYDLNEDVYICVSEYEKVQNAALSPNGEAAHTVNNATTKVIRG